LKASETCYEFLKLLIGAPVQGIGILFGASSSTNSEQWKVNQVC